MSVAASTDTAVTASDVVGMVTKALAVDRNDVRIARTLNSVRLAERLSTETVDLLARMGAGRATVGKLRSLARKSAALPEPAQPPLRQDPEPSPAERAAMVNAMRQYAAGYLASLPDFVCIREAHESRTKLLVSFGRNGLIPTGDIHWRASGEYTSETSYVGGADHYRLILEDGRPTKKTFDQLREKVSSGEFAGALKEVFGSNPEFEWDRWQVIGSLRTVVFAYYVDPARSGYWLCCPRFTTAHRGFVFADPQTGAIRRIIIYATGLTENTPVKAASHVVDFGDVLIGGNRYLLPADSTAYNRTALEESREDVEYRDYRKFGTDATVAFPADDSTSQK